MPIYKIIACGLTLLTVTLTGCTAMVASSAATSIILAQDRRTTGTIVEDQSIEFKANKLIRTITEKKDNIHISVTSYNSNVLLTGQAPTPELKEKLEYSVKNIPKVEKVYNELQIAAPTSVMTRSSDSWITAKVKSEMVLNKRINPTRVKVLTEDGIVYLMGILDKHEENLAVDIARHTKGVKKVIKIFEYLPS